MQPKLSVINNLADLQELDALLNTADFVAYDCETTGLTTSDQVIGFSVCQDEAEAYYVVLSYWDVKTNSLLKIEDPGYQSQAKTIIEKLQSKNLIMHNGVFDCMMAEAFFKVSLINSLHTDTMVLAHLLNENRRVGLKELGAIEFGQSASQEAKEMKDSVIENGGTTTKDNYQMYKADPMLMGKYGAKDAWLTLKLFYKLVPDLYEQNLDKFFYEEESMPLLKGPTYELNTTGLQVDASALAQLKKTLEAECLEAKDFIYQEIAPYIKAKYPGTNKRNTFNIGASQQLSWLVFGQLELEFNTLTKGGKDVCRGIGLKLPYTRAAKRSFIAECILHKDEVYQPEATVNGKKVKAKKIKDPWAYIACDKATLKKLAPKYKWIEKLVEYQRKLKLLNTYVEGIEERVRYGVIRPSFLQHGTTSGRYASRAPNFQNLPRDDKRVKECIIARPGKSFVGADYSQLEPRVFAFTSKDEKLLNAFKTGEDFYSVTGMEVYDKLECVPYKDGYPNAFGVLYPGLRQDSKVFTLASTYGATGPQLAPLMGKSSDEAQQDINSYFEKFPKVQQMMLDSHQLAKTQGYVTNLFGRKRRIPEAKQIVKIYGNLSHAELPYAARKLLNLAVNHRIQSTAASIVNRAAIRFHNLCKEAGIESRLVLQVHDSLIAECNDADAESVSLLMQEAMENTTQLEGIALEATPKIDKNLSKV